MSIFAKKKPVRTSVVPGTIEGPPLSIPLDDDQLIQEISGERKTNIDFAEVVEFHCKRYKEVTGVTLFIDCLTMNIIRAKKVLVDFHFMEIEKIEIVNPREMVLRFREDHPEITLKTHWSHPDGNAETITKAILAGWKYCFPFSANTPSHRPFALEPASKWELLSEIPDEDPGPCQGYLHSYLSICYYYGTPPKKQIIEYIRLLSNQNVKHLNLFEFSNASEEDLAALIHGLQHNTHFTSFTMNQKVEAPEILGLLVTVLLSNVHLREFNIAGIGMTGANIKQLQAAIHSKQGSLSVSSLEMSHNPLEDKGLDYLGDIIGSAPYGFAQLQLSDLSGQKGGLSSFCASLRKNVHLPVTLTVLDLSHNKFDQDTCNNLASWLATPNALVSLSLQGTKVNLDKLADALLRGCVTNLARLNLAKNKLKNLERFSQFIKVSQSLQSLDLSDNPLQLDSLLGLLRNVIVNYSIFDFELYIRNIGLDLQNAETMLGLLSHNIKFLDMSQNFLGPNGLEAVGNGLSANTCLETLIADYCFQQSKKESNLPADTFALFLRSNTQLKVLSMKGDESSCLRQEIIPILEALTANGTITSLDVSGHQAGDSLATAIGRLLQINNTLKSLELDDNAISLVGFQRLRDGLLRNNTLQQMTMPVFDAMSLQKKARKTGTPLTLTSGSSSSSLSSGSSGNLPTTTAGLPGSGIGSAGGIKDGYGSQRGSNQSLGSLSIIIKDMEAKLSQNYSRPKVPDSPRSVASQDDSHKLKFINVGRQKELDLLVHRIRSTGKAASPEQKNLFGDVSNQANNLAQLQAQQEDILKKLNADIAKKKEEFLKNTQHIIKEAMAQFREESLGYIFKSYNGLTEENKQALTAIWNDSNLQSMEAQATKIFEDAMADLAQREAEIMGEVVSKTSTFMYDSLASSLQVMLKDFLKESIRKELGDSDSVRSVK